MFQFKLGVGGLQILVSAVETTVDLHATKIIKRLIRKDVIELSINKNKDNRKTSAIFHKFYDFVSKKVHR